MVLMSVPVLKNIRKLIGQSLLKNILMSYQIFLSRDSSKAQKKDRYVDGIS